MSHRHFSQHNKVTSTEAVLSLLCVIVLLTVYYQSGTEQGEVMDREGGGGKGSTFLMGGRRIKQRDRIT